MIKSTAPTRIDLAGGTLDIWPLYLLLDGSSTLNAAIDLYATVELRPRRDRAICVESRDLGIRARFSSLQTLPQGHPLDLIIQTLRFYRPESGLDIVTDCQAPAGSGIGGSSALGIALNGALNRLLRHPHPRSRLVATAKDIETRVIGTPTGWQDYFPALYGGVQSVRPGGAGMMSEKIAVDLKQLSWRFVLCFTGKPRKSGINNWSVMKKALDGNRRVMNKLSRIACVTREMERALSQGRIDAVGKWFDAEWRARRALAPGISTPEMDRLIALARRHGAAAAKTCGAGGGGCLAFFVREGARDRVAAALRNHGARVLDFRFVSRGLRVSRA
ncbi:MAG: GHMP kinase [Nitrospinales bacterium]